MEGGRRKEERKGGREEGRKGGREKGREGRVVVGELFDV